MLGKPVNVVFIGSCTNGRLEDLQAAARILKGRKVAPGVRLLIVPGSQQIKQQAEASGLREIFKAAGADWRESGCSMCLGMNGDTVAAGQYSISTSNRNFEGRQGMGARTCWSSPLTAAASAVAAASPIRGSSCDAGDQAHPFENRGHRRPATSTPIRSFPRGF